jgi:hypothetical protein
VKGGRAGESGWNASARAQSLGEHVGEEKYVTGAGSEGGLRCAGQSALHAGSRVSSQHQQIRLLPSQFLSYQNQRITVFDRHCWPALTEPQRLDEPGQCPLRLLPVQTGERPSFLLSGAGQREASNVVSETALVCMKKVKARLWKERCRKPYSSRRSVREVDWDEDPTVRGLVRIADHQNGSLGPLQQTPNGGGAEHIRECMPLVPGGHDKIDVMRLRAGRDDTDGISNADIDAVRQLMARQPPANLGLETALGVRPPGFDDRSRKFAVDHVKDGQVAFPFEREPGRSYESDF